MKLIWVIGASYVGHYKINLSFNDGLSATVNLEGYLDGKVFEPLRDLDFFRQFELDSWTVTWPNGADFAPEFLYDLALKETNTAVT